MNDRGRGRDRQAHAQRIAVLMQSLEGGGTQRRMVDLANGFVERGRKVDFLIVESLGDLHDQLDPRVGVSEIGSIPASDKRALAAAVAERLGRLDPDLLMSSSAALQGIAIRALPRRRRFPLVLRADSHPWRTIPWAFPRQRLLEPIRRRLRMKQYASADLVISVADDVAAPIRAANPLLPVVTIPDPVINAAFLAGAARPIELPWADDLGQPIILGIGRLAMAKDFPTLVRAFAHVRRSRPARLVILGEGRDHERASLLRLAARLGIGDDLLLAGSSDRVGAWLSRASVFVSSSLWEGAAGALIEAVAIGCPIVATNCVGSARDLLDNGRLGILVPPRDPRQMAEAIAAQIDGASEHQPDRLRAVAEPYTLGDRADEYLRAMEIAGAHFAARQRTS